MPSADWRQEGEFHGVPVYWWGEYEVRDDSQLIQEKPYPRYNTNWTAFYQGKPIKSCKLRERLMDYCEMLAAE